LYFSECLASGLATGSPHPFSRIAMKKLLALTMFVCLTAFALGCGDKKKTTTTTTDPEKGKTTTTETETDK
jgi:hypothetical protein